MKILKITFFLTLSLSLFGQDKVVGRYRDYFGSRLLLIADKTFKYTWNFDMSSSWTKGTWTLIGDTVYFQMVPTYDTLNRTNSSGILSDTLILSTDEIPERFTQTEFAAMLLSSGGQNRMNYPEKLLLKNGDCIKFRMESW